MTGTDPSTGMLAQARSNLDGLGIGNDDPVEAHVGALSLADDSPGAAVANMVLHDAPGGRDNQCMHRARATGAYVDTSAGRNGARARPAAGSRRGCRDSNDVIDRLPCVSPVSSW